jgi:hypothetical protein
LNVSQYSQSTANAPNVSQLYLSRSMMVRSNLCLFGRGAATMTNWLQMGIKLQQPGIIAQ